MDSTKNVYDAIVVGAGVEGAATGLFLAKKGVKTLILEQFGLYHTRGSSSGETRIIRKAYTEEIYVSMMAEAYKLWEEIEMEFGDKILNQCGGLIVGMSEASKEEIIRRSETNLEKYRIHYEMLDGREIRKRWPILRVENEVLGLWEPTMGMLYVKKAIKAMLSQFVKRGGEIQEYRKVVKMEQMGEKIGQNILKITTHNKEQFFCKKLILCTGPWTNHVLSLVNFKVPISPEKVIVPFWKILEQNTRGISLAEIPVFIFWGSKDVTFFNVMQEYEYPGYLKVALRGSIACDPDKRDSVDIDSITVPKLAQFITNTFPYGMLDTSSPGITEQCIYTMTPDSNSIIDQHPIHSNIYICCGFSGHGFKLAPVIGQLMSDMLYGTETKFDLKYFSLKRFKKAKL